jgi:hypothetical protein
VKRAHHPYSVKNNQHARLDDRSVSLVKPFHTGSGFLPQTAVRRRITPEAGRGLEKLAHALEYLANEFARDGYNVAVNFGRLQAMELLASLNRQLYFSCEVQTTFTERVLAFVHHFSTSST